MYLTAASTISYQPSFRNKGFSSSVSSLSASSELLQPDYAAFIPAIDRRRMSAVLKMAMTCSIDCLDQAGISQPGAIIVGTSMGCSTHSKHFLDKIYDAEGGPLSPTAFIVSTHNTIAGQISLRLKNHCYNMTHTQNSLSFEQGMIDGMLCINEGHDNILIGGCDEEESIIYDMRARLGKDDIHITSGASFFILSKEKVDAASVKLVDVGSFGLINDSKKIITDYLASNKVMPENIDLVLYSNIDSEKTVELADLFGQEKLVDYQKICGTYFTNTAFAMHYGIDSLVQQNHPVPGERVKSVLVCNQLIPGNTGLILLRNN